VAIWKRIERRSSLAGLKFKRSGFKTDMEMRR
jgi:hypothetical protein